MSLLKKGNPRTTAPMVGKHVLAGRGSLKELRVGLKVTQAQLGKALGCSGTRISAIERHDDPKLSVLIRYLSGLGAGLEVGVRLMNGRCFILDIDDNKDG